MVFFFKNFYAGISLLNNDILKIKKKCFNLNEFKIKVIDNNIKLINNNEIKNLLLLKKEINLIIFFLKKKKYKCIPIKFFKIKSFYKILISIIKTGDGRF